MSINSFSQYLKEDTNTVYFTFGRFNPPTIGHGKLMDKMSSVAGKSAYRIFLSQSQDPKKNPLSYLDKIKGVRKMFPKHARSIIANKKINNAFDIAVNLYNAGFKKIVMVVGSDRVMEFDILLKKYNGTKARHGFYNFEDIKVISAGDRDPDASGVEGMSASKQREFVRKNDFMSFANGVPTTMSHKDVKQLFNDIRTGMGLKEKLEFKNHIGLKPVSETREKYVKGDLFELGDKVIVKETQEVGEVTWLGSNYLMVEMNDGKKFRKWLDSVEKIEESFSTSLDPRAARFLDKLINGNKYKKALQYSIELQTKQPKYSVQQLLVQTAKHLQIDYRNLQSTFDKLKTKGLLPAGLIPEEVDYVASVKTKIEREKSSDDVKHDRMLKRASLRNAINKRSQKKNSAGLAMKGMPNVKGF